MESHSPHWAECSRVCMCVVCILTRHVQTACLYTGEMPPWTVFSHGVDRSAEPCGQGLGSLHVLLLVLCVRCAVFGLRDSGIPTDSKLVAGICVYKAVVTHLLWAQVLCVSLPNNCFKMWSWLFYSAVHIWTGCYLLDFARR